MGYFISPLSFVVFTAKTASTTCDIPDKFFRHIQQQLSLVHLHESCGYHTWQEKGKGQISCQFRKKVAVGPNDLWRHTCFGTVDQWFLPQLLYLHKWLSLWWCSNWNVINTASSYGIYVFPPNPKLEERKWIFLSQHTLMASLSLIYLHASRIASCSNK